MTPSAQGGRVRRDPARGPEEHETTGAMTMMPKAWEPLLDRLHDQWRDPILTCLTVLMVMHLFVVAPLETEALHIQPVGAVFVVLLSVALLILSRSLMPVIGII